MNANDPSFDFHEACELWAAGALPIEAERALDAVAKGNVDVAAQMREFHPLVDGLLGCVTPVEPPARIKQAVLSRIGRAPRIHIRRAQAARWEDLGGGLSRRILGIDRHRRTISTLLRMAPGGCLAEHHHHGAEEVLVISGDLRVGGEVYGPGDYFFAEAGSDHGELSTESGCECLLLTALDA